MHSQPSASQWVPNRYGKSLSYRLLHISISQQHQDLLLQLLPLIVDEKDVYKNKQNT